MCIYIYTYTYIHSYLYTYIMRAHTGAHGSNDSKHQRVSRVYRSSHDLALLLHDCLSPQKGARLCQTIGVCLWVCVVGCLHGVCVCVCA